MFWCMVFTLMVAASFGTVEAGCQIKYSTQSSTHSQCINETGSGFVSAHPPNSTERALILSAHNRHRSDVNATNMMRMKWNADIAVSAQNRASACVYAHESDLEKIEPGKFGVGQNIARSSTGYFADWEAVVDYWASEITVFDKNTRYYSSGAGHYSQIVWAETSMVGCGRAVCGAKDLFFCNYAPGGNYMNTEAYSVGDACAECGAARCSNNLCDCGTDNSWNTCLNGGTLDLQTCNCTCTQTFYNATRQCELTTCNDNPGTCPGWPATYCSIFANVPGDCPTLCSICPYAAADYEEE